MGNKGSTQKTETTVPDWINNQWKDLSNTTNSQIQSDIASVNYPAIQNQMAASSQDILNQRMDPKQLASGITQAGSAAWTDPGTAQSYMNPYLNTALASQVKLDRQNLLDPALAGIDQSTAASGALGGDRSQVLKANAMRDFNNTEANTIAQGENTAFNTGLQGYETDAARNLTGQTSGASTQLAGANSNVYADFASGQNNLNSIQASMAPGTQLATQAGILSGIPKQGTQTSTVTPNGGMWGGIASGLLGAAGSVMSGLGGMGVKFKKGGIVDLENPEQEIEVRSPSKKKQPVKHRVKK